MSSPVIRVEKLGKRYRLGESSDGGYRTLRDAVTRSLGSALRRVAGSPSSIRGSARYADDSLWAVRDVSFDVQRGEVLGLIGRNGAGKTTLLKLLSRISLPTEGRAEIVGRVGSLLDVGIGFNPELTGRENVYLGGAILGMSKREITRRFDAILAFAEVERFVDTPVKHYSSGMYARLAFSVAAHLEPDILLIDEVLAVGDAAFQRKCLGELDDAARHGRTILFVSHDMAMILALCDRAILLEDGHVSAIGPAHEIVDRYLGRARAASTMTTLEDLARDGSGQIRFKSLSVSDDVGRAWLSPNRPAIFKMTLVTEARGIQSSYVTIAIGISNSLGHRLVELQTRFDPEYQSRGFILQPETVVICRTEQFPLRPGMYFLTLYVDYANELCDRIRDGIKVEVKDADFFGTGVMPSTSQGWLMLAQRWSLET